MYTSFRVCRDSWRTRRSSPSALVAAMEGTGSGLAHGPFPATPAAPGHAVSAAQPCCNAPFASVGSTHTDSGSGACGDQGSPAMLPPLRQQWGAAPANGQFVERTMRLQNAPPEPKFSPHPDGAQNPDASAWPATGRYIQMPQMPPPSMPRFLPLVRTIAAPRRDVSHAM